MSEASWKRSERAIARALGGTRIPVSGRARGDAPDVQHRWLSVEVKHRQSIPQWLKDAMSQAQAAAVPGQRAIAVLHQSGERHANDLVVLRLGDFVGWLSPVPDHTGP